MNMKKYVWLIVLAASLASCSAADGSVQSGGDVQSDGSIDGDLASDDIGVDEDSSAPDLSDPIYEGNDFEPPTGAVPAPSDTDVADGPWNRRLLVARSDDEGLTWTRTGAVLTDRADVPSAVRDEAGRIFIYYISYHPEYRDQIVAAVSLDEGLSWVHKEVDLGLATGQRGADPAAVLLDDGRIRVYFSSRIQGGYTATHSSVSDDGLNFTLEDGVRWELDEEPVIAPTVLKTGDTWRLFRIGDGGSNMEATATDGLTFSDTRQLDFGDRFIVGESGLAVTGGYRLYLFQNMMSDRQSARIASAFSVDGEDWTLERGGLSFDSAILQETDSLRNGTVVATGQGEYLMFYLSVIP